MYGHEGVSRDLTDRLGTALPVALQKLREQTGATTQQLADPARVRPYFVADIDADRYPFVAVTELDTPTGLTGSRGIHQDMPYTSYIYRYPFRIWTYVMGRTYGDTELQLKRYLTAVRMVLLDSLQLTENDEASVLIDVATISENFYPPDESAQQVLGAGFIGVVLESTEIFNRLEPQTPPPGSPYIIRPSIGHLDANEPPDPFGEYPTAQ